MTRLALALICCSCAHSDAVAFRVYDTRGDSGLEELEEACDFWSLDCYTTDASDGAVTLFLVERGASVEGGRLLQGIATHYKGCAPNVLSIGHPGTIAHELGHALGWLPDIGDPDNVMCDEDQNRECIRPGPRATKRQRKAVMVGVERLALCVGGVAP